MVIKFCMSKKQLFIYIGIIFSVSWAIQILAIAVNGSINAEESRLWLALTMISPSLLTFIYLNKYKTLRSEVIVRPNKKIVKMTLWAVIIPIIIGLTVLKAIDLLNLGQSDWFTFKNTNVIISDGPWILGLKEQNLFYFALNIIITGITYAFLNMPIAAGEEFAWRGFLQGQLTNKFGLIKGLLILGFIWSMWHLPALLNGYNFPENPILGSFVLFPIQLMSLSVFYGWLTIKCKSFIPAAIAHGALNSIQEAMIFNTTLQVPILNLYLIRTSITALIGLIFLYLLIKQSGKTDIPNSREGSKLD